MVRSYGRIMRVHEDFDKLVKEMSRKTQIPRIKITQKIAAEMNKPSLKINMYPLKGKAIVRQLEW